MKLCHFKRMITDEKLNNIYNISSLDDDKFVYKRVTREVSK